MPLLLGRTVILHNTTFGLDAGWSKGNIGMLILMVLFSRTTFRLTRRIDMQACACPQLSLHSVPASFSVSGALE